MKDRDMALSRWRRVAAQLVAIPFGADYRAHRYDTDNESVLHLWQDGLSYDIRWPKPRKATGRIGLGLRVDGACQRQPEAAGAVPQQELIAMAKDWTDPAVVRDAPERVPHVIEQLIAEIQRLSATAQK